METVIQSVMQMSSSFKLKSHPEKPLEIHLTNVAFFSKDRVLEKNISNQQLYSEIAFLIGLSHDFAKATTYFQNYLNDHIKTEKARHGLLSAIFGYYNIQNYLKTNNLDDFWYIAPLVWLVILRHHGNLKNIRGMNGESENLKDLSIVEKQIVNIENNNLKELIEFYDKWDVDVSNFFKEYKTVIKNIKRDLKNISRKKGLDHYFLTLFFYSILLDADKMDASNTELPKRIEISDNIVD